VIVRYLYQLRCRLNMIDTLPVGVLVINRVRYVSYLSCYLICIRNVIVTLGGCP
jgi:hypothetical protein